MKINPNKPHLYRPQQEMKYLKRALENQHLYETDELRKIKARLTELRQERAEPNQTGLGFL
jgi:hypothetical protein|tara:strand:+ start:665 stop:847 length:183 start_codon:yes stop_codon:yes gene_type:complete